MKPFALPLRTDKDSDECFADAEFSPDRSPQLEIWVETARVDPVLDHYNVTGSDRVGETQLVCRSGETATSVFVWDLDE